MLNDSDQPLFKHYYQILASDSRARMVFPFSFRHRNLQQNIELIGTALLIASLKLMQPKDISKTVLAFEILSRKAN
jgi:hypothetical protein